MKPTPSQLEAAIRLQQASAKPLIILEQPFPLQDAFVHDHSRYLDVQCSRRAGKTNGLARKFKLAMDKYPGSRCLYLALTAESAKDIMWPVLIEFNEKYKWGATFMETSTTMILPNGSRLVLLGADQPKFIKRIKGRKYPAIGIDEAQDFGPHLESLINDVLTPCIVDYPDSWLALTGTPGPVPQGYYFDITRNRRYGFSHHEWTILDNPYIPDAEAFILDMIKRREWLDNNPTLLREWRNQWVLDVQSLWVRYSADKNHFITLPPNDTYSYLLGVDIGFRDADALAVVAWGDKSPRTYLVEEQITAKQGMTELVEQIEAMRAKYDIKKIIMDEGGLGKKMAEEMRRRHHIPIHPAEKTRKQETVEFLNDSMRVGNFMAKSASRFAQDSYLVQIDWSKSTPDKIVIKKSPHSDIIDAVLYAFKESPAFTYQKPLDKAAPGTPEWHREQARGMFEAEMEGLQAEAAENRRIWGD
jgi:hypothetical protein